MSTCGPHFDAGIEPRPPRGRASSSCDPEPVVRARRPIADLQRKEPLAVGKRTRDDRHQADIQSGSRRGNERQQRVEQPPPQLLPASLAP